MKTNIKTQLFALHQALWRGDVWYRRAWYVWPQSLAIFAGFMLFMPGTAPLPPAAAPWVKPVASSAGAVPSADSQLCNNVLIDARQRGEACDRLIKGGNISGLPLAAAYFGRAWMRQIAGEIDAAIADYTESLKLNPGNHIAYNGRGWMHVLRNDLDKAGEDFNRSLDINRTAANSLAYANRAEVRRRQGRLDEAAVDIAEARRLDDKLEFSRTVQVAIDADRLRASRPPPSPTQVAGTQPATTPSSAPPTTGTPASPAVPDPDRQLCSFATAETVQRGEACDRVIKAGKATAIELSTAYFQRGYMRERAFQYNDALADYSDAIKHNPSSFPAYNGRGWVHIQLGDVDKAIENFDRSLELNRGANAVAFTYRAEAFRRKGRLDEASADIAEALKLDRTLELAARVRASIQADRDQTRQSGPTAPAAGATPSSVATAPPSPPAPPAPNADAAAARARIETAMQKQDWDTAMAELSARIQRGGAWEDYNLRGRVHLNLRNVDAAAADFSEAVRMAGHDWSVHFNLGVARARRNDVDGAIAELNRAINDHKGSAPIVFNLRGQMKERKRLYMEAEQDYRTLSKLTPNDPEVYFLLGRVQAANVKVLIEMCQRPRERRDRNEAMLCDPLMLTYVPALNELEKALSLNPKLPAVHMQIGDIKSELRRHDEAMASYSKCVGVDPNFSDCYYRRGVLHQGQKQNELALADYNEAIRANARNMFALVNRAGLLAAAGQRQKAVADYRQALAIDANYVPALDGLKRLGVKP